MKRLILADIDIVMDIYLNKIVLTTADIMRLFNCKSGAAGNMKKRALQYMEEHGKTAYDAGSVYTKDAFEAWHIDIKDIKKRWTEKQKLKERSLAR